MTKTRITHRGLNGKEGSIEMPEGVSYCCPRCGTSLADKDQCLAEFVLIPSDDSVTGFVLGMLADCRSCGYNSGPPAVNLKPHYQGGNHGNN